MQIQLKNFLVEELVVGFGRRIGAYLKIYAVDK